MVYHGEYAAPHDLAATYSNIHFNWCVDLSGHNNSFWLLPNRLYEGGYFGIPAIAIASHETGRAVSERRLGVAVDAPVSKHLVEYFLKLTCEDYRELRERLENLPTNEFVDTGEVAALIRGVPTWCDEPARLCQRVESVT
jgi:succinoglycan biosynthesis protein ExoL